MLILKLLRLIFGAPLREFRKGRTAFTEPVSGFEFSWCELWPSWLCDATPVMCSEGLAKCLQVMWEG